VEAVEVLALQITHSELLVLVVVQQVVKVLVNIQLVVDKLLMLVVQARKVLQVLVDLVQEEMVQQVLEEMVAVVEQDHRNMLVELDLETVVLEPITVVTKVRVVEVVDTLAAEKVVVTAAV
jgi:hypothetical protein